jgi:hypothetical protein
MLRASLDDWVAIKRRSRRALRSRALLGPDRVVRLAWRERPGQLRDLHGRKPFRPALAPDERVVRERFRRQLGDELLLTEVLFDSVFADPAPFFGVVAHHELLNPVRTT